MCDIPTEDIVFSIVNDIDQISNTTDEDLVREFREFANLFCPSLSHRGYYDLSYTPPWISEDLLKYSLEGVSALKV